MNELWTKDQHSEILFLTLVANKTLSNRENFGLRYRDKHVVQEIIF